MANTQTYIGGLGGTDQVTTLSNIKGAGLNLPVPNSDFIDTRGPGKIEALFRANGNANTLYTKNRYEDSYLKGPVASTFIYKSIESGQRNRISPTNQSAHALQDSARITKFLGTSAGSRFILNQLIIQGRQAFDETKVYNPASPILAAFQMASYGLLDSPTRHIDTSNLIGGLIGASGLGSIVRTVGGLFGGGESMPSPPRSSVASGASAGFGISTFTSLLGGSDYSDRVVSPLARADVKGLLRGQTATNAFNATRYNKLIPKGKVGFFSGLLKAAGNFLQNNTLIGGILPPKQPWAAKYRADEATYDYYLNSGKLFSQTSSAGSGGGGILQGVLNAVGFGKKSSYSEAVKQRFYNGVDSTSNYVANYNRTIMASVPQFGTFKRVTQQTDKLALRDYDGIILIGQLDKSLEISGQGENAGTRNFKYSDVVAIKNGGNSEQSDQLINYKAFSENTKNFPDTFSDKQSLVVKDIIATLDKSVSNIAGTDANKKYNIETNQKLNSVYMQQFGKKINQQVQIKDGIGFNYLNNIKKTHVPAEDITYEGKWRYDEISYKRQTKVGRKIQPTNDVDYVNSLEVLTEEKFKKLYSESDQYNEYGPDFIKFYFYDIVNQKYIPFKATIKSLNESNNANWETVEYLGRPDKMYYYKGFDRQINFSFVVNAHSVKELMPMWQRINYLVGFTMPSNYTMGKFGGFMIPPMVQLTLGDFYKNHFVVITSCNVTIPDDASWETLPENLNTKDWYWGINKAFEWKDSKGKFAQFPRTAEISLNMNVLAKDRPKVGRALWGDSFANNAPIVEKFKASLSGETDISKFISSDELGITSEENLNITNNDFSTKIRVETNNTDMIVDRQ